MIEFQNVSFSYQNSRENAEVANINLQVPDGQVVLLTGPYGCGKSTVLRLINGLAPHFYEGTVEGEIFVNGLKPRETPLVQLAPVVGSVFQNPRTQFYHVDTTGELAFACENQGMAVDEIQRRIQQTVTQFQIEDLMNRNMFALSGGQKQQIACASVDVAQPDIFLLDEPTANLDYEATQTLKEIVARWKRAGKTILIAEHRIAWVWELCDRILVMEQGTIRADWNREQMQKLSTEELLRQHLRTKEEKNPLTLVKSCDCMEKVQIKNLTYAYQKKKKLLQQTTFAFPANHITAIVGKNGEGKTTLLHCMAGILRKYKATVEDRGVPIRNKDLWKRTFLVMQDVNHQLFTESVLDEVLISMKTEDKGRALAILEQVHLKAYADRHPMSLSGGQKQRVAIACAVASDKDILLLDEPTSGLDRYHMEQMAKLFTQLKNMGKTIVMVTHDSELMELCCDAILPLQRNGEYVCKRK